LVDPLLQNLQAINERYQVERELGRGGMATVYLALDLRLHRQVALKVLRPELAASLGKERFLREIEIAARLSHPHILPLSDSGETGGHLFYVMPYVEGESLRQRLESEGQLPVAEVIAIVRAVASALTYAHHHGVVHRDIKPENILLARDSEGGAPHPVVADFGIARALDASGGERLTETGLALGTPAYMSPEQAASGRLDGRSDIYALGCLAYEMLAGQPPFVGATAQAILARHAVDPVPSLHTVRATIPASIEAAIERALAKVPADRFATADEFARALTAEEDRKSRLLRGLRVHRTRLVLGVAAGALAAGAAAVILPGSSPAVVPLAATMAVLPFSGGTDTALARLGRDLAVTIGASLDGIGGIKTTDRLRVGQETSDRRARSLDGDAALARRLGASSLLRGTLVRVGSQVRLDLGLYGTEGLAPLAAGITVTAHRDSIGTLTDSASWALLRRVWQRGEPPSPSLAAVTTRSLPALRSFLDGERHLEKDEWKLAALAYRSAIAADSTFWLAYFRYVLAQRWNEEDIEPEILSSLHLNRKGFPDRERLLVEIHTQDTLPPSGDAELLQELTRRFPDYWPGWFYYGDFLYHIGPYLGYSWKDTQKALGRAVALNPRLKPAYHHMFWNSVGKDTVESARALGRFLALPGVGPSTNPIQAAADLQLMRLVDAMARSAGVISLQDSGLADSVARFYLSPSSDEVQKFMWPMIFIWAENPAGQIAFNRRVLRYTADVTSVPSVYRGSAYAWAERGAWDSALGTAREGVKNEPRCAPQGCRPPASIVEYNIAVLGAWLGAIAPQEAVDRRSAAAATISGLEASRWKTELLGGQAWFDGLLAFVLRDGPSLERAREHARQSGHPAAAIIDRSLAAFGRALAGDRTAAARELVALERLCGGKYWRTCGSSFVPNTAAHRLAAATWLLEAGDTAQAARLLTWHEAWYFRHVRVWSFVVRPLAYLMQARIEEARGNTPSAREHYERFLRHYDSPMPGQRHLVEEAQAALKRLSGRNDPSATP
jgi:tRNA A-37 threonylcarbamoyl transferase component Bud32